MDDEFVYFVVYSGNTQKSLNFYGVNKFNTLDEANEFIDRIQDRYDWNLIMGTEIDYSERYD